MNRRSFLRSAFALSPAGVAASTEPASPTCVGGCTTFDVLGPVATFRLIDDLLSAPVVLRDLQFERCKKCDALYAKPAVHI